jgi:hypothetical protein
MELYSSKYNELYNSINKNENIKIHIKKIIKNEKLYEYIINNDL